MGKKRGDIDTVYNALRPRLRGMTTTGSSVPTMATIPPHSHSADQISSEPAGNLAGVDVQEVEEELDSEKLARDGSQTMLGTLPMNSNNITGAKNVGITGGVGDGVISFPRVITMAGDDDDGEALIENVERVKFNNEPTKSVIENPSTVEFNAAVTPGTDRTVAEGSASWSDLERAFMVDFPSGAAALAIALGWGVTLCANLEVV